MFPRNYESFIRPSPKMRAYYERERQLEQMVDAALSELKRRKLHKLWNENLDTAYDYVRMLVSQQRSEERAYMLLKPYKRISPNYERPFVFPKWVRHLHDTLLDFVTCISSFTLEKWILSMAAAYFSYVLLISVFYPLYNAVRKEFLHPRFFVKSPRWFVDENWLHRRTKFIFVYNFLAILSVVVFFLFYSYELIPLLQYYDGYYYYRHMYHTVPFTEGGSSRGNGGVISTLGKKKRVPHPERGTPYYYALLLKDRW